MKKFWLFAFNFLYYGSYAFFLPFLVLYYQSLQFSGLEIGILTGASPLILLVSAPLFTNLADAKGWHRPIMGISIASVVILIALIPFTTNFVFVLLLILAMNVFLGPIVPFVDSATMHMLGDEKDMYGRVRLGGTLGWAIIAIVAGAVVESYDLRAAFWAGAFLLFFPFLISLGLVYKRNERKSSEQRSVFSLLQNPLWIRFLAIAFISGVVLAVSNSYFFIYLTELNAPESMMGIALSIGAVMEIPALFFGNRLLAILKPYPMLIIAMLLAGVRLILFGFVDNLWLVLLIQPLGGLSFVMTWMGGVAYANEQAPESLSSTAQGLFSAMIFGVGSAVGGILGGLLLESMTVKEIYLIIGIGVFISLVAITGIWSLLVEGKLKKA